MIGPLVKAVIRLFPRVAANFKIEVCLLNLLRRKRNFQKTLQCEIP